jgi:hypothetical protein
MSRYAVNSLLYRLKMEPEFRARFIADPAAALEGVDLSEPEPGGLPRPRHAQRSTRSAGISTSSCRSRGLPPIDGRTTTQRGAIQR